MPPYELLIQTFIAAHISYALILLRTITLSPQKYCYHQRFKGTYFFLHFGLKNNYLVTVWAFDLTIFSCTFLTALSRLRTITLSHKICHCQYFKRAKFFCIFGLKIIILSPYKLLTEIFPAPYTTSYVPIKFPLGKKVRLWCNSANFWSKYGIFFFFFFFWFQIYKNGPPKDGNKYFL